LNEQRPPSILILSGPSGAGKTTLANALIASHPEFEFAVSHTTRSPRPGETDGVQYHFVSEDEFMDLVRRGEMLEYATVYGRHYGTSRQAVEHALQSGHRVLLDVDWQGSRHLREIYPEAVSVFVQPPDGHDAASRLQDRQQDDAETIAARMALYDEQMSHRDEFDYVIVNDILERAIAELSGIVDRPAPTRDQG